MGAYIVKYDVTGAFEWGVQIDSAGADEAYVVAVDSNDEIIVAGTFNGTADFEDGAGSTNLTTAAAGFETNLFIAKYSTAGVLQWAKSMSGNGALPSAIKALSDNSFVMVGSLVNGSNVDFDPDPTGNVSVATAVNNHVWLAKYDSTGDFVFVKSIFAASPGSFSFGKTIGLTNTNQIVLTGSFAGAVDFDPSGATTTITPAGSREEFLAVYDSSGNFVNVKSWNCAAGAANFANMGLGIQSDGSFVVGITFNQDFDADPSGATFPITKLGGWDIAIIKLDSNLNFVWAKQIAGAGTFIMGGTVSVFDDDSFLMSGVYAGTVDFDPSAGTSELTASVASQDAYFARYDSDGILVWAKSVGGSLGSEVVSAVPVVTSDGSVYVTFGFNGLVDFDPGSGTQNLGSSGAITDVFMGKFN